MFEWYVQVHLYGTTEPESQAGALSTQLSLLQSLRLPERTELHLNGVHMTHEAMDTLRSLPLWGKHLTFAGCTWPMAPGEYKRLAQCIPSVYRGWHIRDVARRVFRSVCKGVPAERPEGMERLCIRWRNGQESDTACF